MPSRILLTLVALVATPNQHPEPPPFRGGDEYKQWLEETVQWWKERKQAVLDTYR